MELLNSAINAVVNPGFMYAVAFWTLAAVTVGSALLVATMKNLSRAVIFLTIFFLGVGGLYFLMQAKFLAMIQVVVYAGAVSVLFAFVIMLSPGLPGTRTRQSANQGLALLAAGLFLATLAAIIVRHAKGSLALGKGLDLATLGRVLFTDYLLPFELVSIVLLVALVGAIMFTSDKGGGDEDASH